MNVLKQCVAFYIISMDYTKWRRYGCDVMAGNKTLLPPHWRHFAAQSEATVAQESTYLTVYLFMFLGSAHAAHSTLLKWTFLSTDRQLSLYLHRRRTDPGSTRFYFNPSLHSRNAADPTALQRIPKVMSRQHCTALLAYRMLSVRIKCY